jgi:teichuronic acid biosynthesis glycosyltransferase TuaC
LTARRQGFVRMRVLVVTNMYPTRERPEFGRFVHDQVEDVRGRGIDVEVLAFDGTVDWRRYFRTALQLRSRLERGRFDLIHAHYGLTGAVAVTQRRLPVITTFHGSDYDGPTWQRTVSRVVARLSTPIVVSSRGRQLLGRPAAAVIPAGVDTDLLEPRNRTEARRQLGWDTSAPYALLPSSRGVRLKRADLFDAAVSLARRAVPELRSASLEHLTRAEVACVMNAVDVTILTSDSEGSPVAVRESLACLTPVVAVPVGDVVDVLRGLPGCAVVPRDPQAIAGAIVAALGVGRPPELRERALQTSRSRIAAEVTAIYENVLMRRQSG